jgi:hypothetical protein
MKTLKITFSYNMISAVLCYPGVALIWWQTNWIVALGVFLVSLGMTIKLYEGIK